MLEFWGESGTRIGILSAHRPVFLHVQAVYAWYVPWDTQKHKQECPKSTGKSTEGFEKLISPKSDFWARKSSIGWSLGTPESVLTKILQFRTS